MTLEDFGKQLGAVFIPSAVQTQVPLGMTAYLPTVLPYDKPVSLPDEIALVFYESKEVYERTFRTTAGRAYALLHGTVFAPTRGLPPGEPKSASGWPALLNNEVETNKAYHLFKTETDWQKGSVQLFVGARKADLDPADFTKEVGKVLKKIQMSPPKGLDGAIAVQTEEYLIYWEHWAGKQIKNHSGLAELRQVAEPVHDQEAYPVKVVGDTFAEYPGPKIKGGECLNLQFARRKEFYW